MREGSWSAHLLAEARVSRPGPAPTRRVTTSDGRRAHDHRHLARTWHGTPCASPGLWPGGVWVSWHREATSRRQNRRDTSCVWYWSRHGALTGRHVPWLEVLLWVAILGVGTAGIVLTVPMDLAGRIFLVTVSTVGLAWIFVPLMMRFRRNSSQRRPADRGRDRPAARP
jgi:hypothetical protein